MISVEIFLHNVKENQKCHQSRLPVPVSAWH